MNTPVTPIVSSQRQQGSMLLEALIAILIFSLGILAVVGMQASAVQAVSDAKYRADASLLATQLVGQMRASDRTNTTLTTFSGGAGTDGSAYSTWRGDVEILLPGAGSTPPVVQYDSSTRQVSITIFWSAPNDSQTHQFQLVTQIS